jgi:hypothetical protein
MINLRKSSMVAGVLAVALLAPAGVAGASGKAAPGHAKKRPHHATRIHKSSQRPGKTRRPGASKPKVKGKGKGKGSSKRTRARTHHGKSVKKHGKR